MSQIDQAIRRQAEKEVDEFDRSLLDQVENHINLHGPNIPPPLEGLKEDAWQTREARVKQMETRIAQKVAENLKRAKDIDLLIQRLSNCLTRP